MREEGRERERGGKGESEKKKKLNEPGRENCECLHRF
jgi:hypothetical protein